MRLPLVVNQRSEFYGLSPCKQSISFFFVMCLPRKETKKKNCSNVCGAIIDVKEWEIDIHLPSVFEFNEGKRWSPTVFQIDECHLTEFMEQILNILCTYIWWQITDVNSTFITVTVRHGRLVLIRFLSYLTKTFSFKFASFLMRPCLYLYYWTPANLTQSRYARKKWFWHFDIFYVFDGGHLWYAFTFRLRMRTESALNLINL